MDDSIGSVIQMNRAPLTEFRAEWMTSNSKAYFELNAFVRIEWYSCTLNESLQIKSAISNGLGGFQFE